MEFALRMEQLLELLTESDLREPDIFFLQGLKKLVGIKMERPTSHPFRWAILFFKHLFINGLHASNSVSTFRYIVGYLLGFRTQNA
jgi:hypothetical protein